MNWKTQRGAEAYARHASESQQECYIVFKREFNAAANGVPPSTIKFHSCIWPMDEPLPSGTLAVFINGGKAAITL